MIGNFARSLLHTAAKRKTNNHASALGAKVEIRRRVLDVVGAENAAVFDAFAGGGELYRHLWNKAASYVGCDLDWYRDERLMFVADNHRVMRAIDLTAFNLFDFDSWGSPWEQVLILAARRPVAAGERIGLVLSEGSSFKLRMGRVPDALARLASVRPLIDGAARVQDDIIDRALAGTCRRMNCRIVRRWQGRVRIGAHMRYIGLVLEGLPAALGDAIAATGTGYSRTRNSAGHSSGSAPA
jgi:hypothetical protein